jgi:hypothetical protein
MLQTSFQAITREQFKQLRRAKKLVKDEFQADLKLQDPKVMDKLYEYALESEGEELFEIFTALNGETAKPEQPAPAKAAPPARASSVPHKNVRIGDVVDGQRCVSIYRGKPVFKPV